MQPGEELRPEVIETITTTGIHLVKEHFAWDPDGRPNAAGFAELERGDNPAKPAVGIGRDKRPANLRGAALAITADGGQVVCDDPTDLNALTVWDVKASRVVARLRGRGVYGRVTLGPRSPRGAQFSPDGTFLAVLGFQHGNQMLRLWDVEAGLELASLPDVAYGEYRWGEDGRFFESLGASSRGTPFPKESLVREGTQHSFGGGEQIIGDKTVVIPATISSGDFWSLWEIAHPTPSYSLGSAVPRCASIRRARG